MRGAFGRAFCDTAAGRTLGIEAVHVKVDDDPFVVRHQLHAQGICAWLFAGAGSR